MLIIHPPVLVGLLLLLGLLVGSVLYLILDVRGIHRIARDNAAHREKNYKEIDASLHFIGQRLQVLEGSVQNLNALHPPETTPAQPKPLPRNDLAYGDYVVEWWKNVLKKKWWS